MMAVSRIGIQSDSKADPYADLYVKRHLSAIAAVLEDYSNIESRSIFFIIFANFINSIKNIFRNIWSWFASKEEYILNKQQDSFINLVYILLHFGVNNSDPKFFDKLKYIAKKQHSSDQQKLDTINRIIAGTIYKSYITRLRKGKNVGLSYLQIYQLKKTYDIWVRNLPIIEDIPPKYYIYRRNKFTGGYKIPAHKYQLELDKQGIDVKPKTPNIFKKLFFLQASIAIFFTAIAQGLIPAVLSAAINGGLLYSIAVIGIPSIIIDYILFNTAVNNLIKDIWYDRLLKDEDSNYIWASIPLFIIALSGGITYGTMAYTTSLIAFQGILIALFPAVAPGFLLNITICTAVISAFYVFISSSALFFNSMIDIARQGIYQEFKKFISCNFINRFYEKDNGFLWNLAIVILKFIAMMSLLLGAIYLTLLQTALLYSMALGLLQAPALALVLVLIAAPANLIFTFKVYNFALEVLLNLPRTIINFCKYLANSYSNPVILYETLKWVVAFIMLGIFDLISAKGSADGLVEETKELSCKTILEPFGIDPNKSSIEFMSGLTEGIDDLAANLQEIVEIVPLQKTIIRKDTQGISPFNLYHTTRQQGSHVLDVSNIFGTSSQASQTSQAAQTSDTMEHCTFKQAVY